MAEQLSRYKGPLTSEQIASGMNAAARNSKRLAEDAKLMLEQGRNPSAAGLAILSIEESGKLRVLRELALARDEAELNAAWREYRQHTSKNQLWLLIDSVLNGAVRLHEFRHLFDQASKNPQLLDQLKQISFYSDCFDGHWSVPQEVVNADLAKMLVCIANVLCGKPRVFTVEEIDLWIFYMQPVYRKSIAGMEHALIEWDREMRTRGLLTGNCSMEDFVLRGIARANETNGVDERKSSSEEAVDTAPPDESSK